MSNIVDAYFTAKTALLKNVGLYPDWVEFPLDDCREMYWRVSQSHVLYSEEKQKVIDAIGEHYEDEGCTKEYYQFWTKYWLQQQQDPEWAHLYKDDIYTQRFYPKWVYRGTDFTLIFCDPHVDGCKWWRIFANDKEVKN